MVYFLVNDVRFCQILDQIYESARRTFSDEETSKKSKNAKKKDKTSPSRLTIETVETPMNDFVLKALLHIRQTTSTVTFLQLLKLFLALEANFLRKIHSNPHHHRPSKMEDGVAHALSFDAFCTSLITHSFSSSSSSPMSFTAFVEEQTKHLTLQRSQTDELLHPMEGENGMKGSSSPAVDVIVACADAISSKTLRVKTVALLLQCHSAAISETKSAAVAEENPVHHDVDRTGLLAVEKERALVGGPLERLGVLFYLLSSFYRMRQEREHLLTSAALHTDSRSSKDELYPMKKELCFHDRDLLLPIPLVNTILSWSQQVASTSLTEATLNPPAMDAFRLAAACHRERSAILSSTSAERKTASGAHHSKASRFIGSNSAIILIICPAVSTLLPDEDEVEDNEVLAGLNAVKTSLPAAVERRMKNDRVELIQQASTAYYYDHLVRQDSTGAHTGRSTPESIRPLYEKLFDMDLFGQYSGDPPVRGTVEGKERGSHPPITVKSMMGDISIGVDMLVMLFSGAAVGYFLGALRGASEVTKLLYMLVGMTVMLFADGLLLMTRMHEIDLKKESQMRRRRKFWQQKSAVGKRTEPLSSSVPKSDSCSASLIKKKND